MGGNGALLAAHMHAGQVDRPTSAHGLIWVGGPLTHWVFVGLPSQVYRIAWETLLASSIELGDTEFVTGPHHLDTPNTTSLYTMSWGVIATQHCLIQIQEHKPLHCKDMLPFQAVS